MLIEFIDFSFGEAAHCWACHLRPLLPPSSGVVSWILCLNPSHVSTSWTTSLFGPSTSRATQRSTVCSWHTGLHREESEDALAGDISTGCGPPVLRVSFGYTRHRRCPCRSCTYERTWYLERRLYERVSEWRCDLRAEKKSLLSRPSFVKPKKKTNVVSIKPCFVNSALLYAFFDFSPFMSGRPAFVRFS